MFRARRFGIALGMVILTAASLAYVATMSGARNAEQSVLKAERIESDNRERERISKLREQAQAMLSTATLKAAEECATGKGSKCEGRTTTRDVYDAAVRGHDSKLEKLGPTVTPNAGYKAAAEAITRLPWTSHRKTAEVEKDLIVLLPWLAVLIAELGTIVFLSSALGHKSVPSFSDSVQSSFSTVDAPSARAALMDNGPGNDPPKGGKRKTTRAIELKTTNVVAFPSPAVVHPVIRALSEAGRYLSLGELAKMMGCSTSEASKRWQEVADQLDMGWNGRFRSIGLKSWRQASA